MDRKNLFEITRQSIGRKGTALYNLRATAIIMLIHLSACNVDRGSVKNEQEGNATPEPPAVVVHIDSALASRAYPITDISAGPFRIGAVIRDTIGGFDLEKSTESKTTPEEKSVEIPIYTYYIGNEGWVRVRPQYDPATGQVSDKTGEIFIYSELFMTDKYIGAISSLEDFASVYPDMNIRYISEYDMFAVVTPQLPNVQFLLESGCYIDAEHDSDSSIRRRLDLSDFEEKSHFYAIRISKQ